MISVTDQFSLLYPAFVLLERLRSKDIVTFAMIGIDLALHYESSDQYQKSLQILEKCHKCLVEYRDIVTTNGDVRLSHTTNGLDHQTLFCIHTELYTHITRVTIKLGIEVKYREMIESNHVRASPLRIKEENPHIFTKMYKREQEKLESLKKPPTRPTSNTIFEQRLKDQAGVNSYELGLLHMILSFIRRSSTEKETELKRSFEHFETCESIESHRHVAHSTANDLELNNRTAHSLIMKLMTESASTFSYILYAKAMKDGTRITTSDSNLTGTGVTYFSEELCHVENLDSNTEYHFGVQILDDVGRPSGNIRKVNKTFSTIHALPLQLCWCYLSLASSLNGFHAISKKAANKVLGSLLVREEGEETTTGDRGNPLSQFSLNDEELRNRIPRILLYEIIRVIDNFAEAELNGSKESFRLVDRRFGSDYYSTQMARLTICNKFLLVLRIANYIKDHQLISESICKIYDTLIPILDRQARISLLSSTFEYIFESISNLPVDCFENSRQCKIFCNIVYVVLSRELIDVGKVIKLYTTLLGRTKDLKGLYRCRVIRVHKSWAIN